MRLTKENCQLLKITSANRETGEQTISAFITHPDFKENVRLLGLNEDGSKMSFDDVLEKCKANPDWRQSIRAKNSEYGYYFVFSNSVVEEMAV